MKPAPDDHFDARPKSRMQRPFKRRNRRRHPIVIVWIVPPARIRNVVAQSCPNDHFTPSPNCRMTIPGRRRVSCAGSYPTICNRIVSPACVNRPIKPTPDDHLAAGPNSRVIVTGGGRVRGASGCPTVRARVIPPAGV
jgi:hypothetical protein